MLSYLFSVLLLIINELRYSGEVFHTPEIVAQTNCIVPSRFSSLTALADSIYRVFCTSWTESHNGLEWKKVSSVGRLTSSQLDRCINVEQCDAVLSSTTYETVSHDVENAKAHFFSSSGAVFQFLLKCFLQNSICVLTGTLFSSIDAEGINTFLLLQLESPSVALLL